MFTKWDSAFAHDGWLSIFLANHDQARLVSRFGNDSPAFRERSAKLLNTFILSMRGTPYCYYGDELGMTNIVFERIDQYQDIAAINGYKKVKNDGGDLENYLLDLKFSSRDNGRTPMQWDDTKNAGFTSATPWLPVNPNHVTLNVKHQQEDPNSVLNHFRKLTALRKGEPVLIYGAYEIILREHPAVYAYARILGNKKVLVLLNFSTKESVIELPQTKMGRVWINNYDELKQTGNTLALSPYQAVIVEADYSENRN